MLGIRFGRAASAARIFVLGGAFVLGAAAWTPPAVAQTAPAGGAPAAVSAPVAMPVPVAGEPGKVEVANPYGLGALWKNGDFVARGTLFVLAVMSFGSWYILFTKFWEQFKLLSEATTVQKSFWTADSIATGLEALKPQSAFRFIAQSGMDANSRHAGPLMERIDLNTWISLSIDRAVMNVQNRLQDGLAFLATVGSTAPFVGLFGTVWGIYHALTAIGIAGQASIDKVAGPVGEALIMTAFGLLVAVPAVLGYNLLVRRNKVALERVRAFSADLHLTLLGGSGKGA